METVTEENALTGAEDLGDKVIKPVINSELSTDEDDKKPIAKEYRHQMNQTDWVDDHEPASKKTKIGNEAIVAALARKPAEATETDADMWCVNEEDSFANEEEEAASDYSSEAADDEDDEETVSEDVAVTDE